MDNGYRAGSGYSMILDNVWADLRPCHSPCSTLLASDARPARDEEPSPFTQTSRIAPREWPVSAGAARAE